VLVAVLGRYTSFHDRTKREPSATRLMGVKQSPGTVRLTWRRKGSVLAWLLAILSRICQHKAFWTVERLVLQLRRVQILGNPDLRVSWRRCLSLLLGGKGENQQPPLLRKTLHLKRWLPRRAVRSRWRLRLLVVVRLTTGWMSARRQPLKQTHLLAVRPTRGCG